nr:hypothetical protein [Actinomycetota bacterium]
MTSTRAGRDVPTGSPLPLADLVEGVAQASGAWVLVEQFNVVVGHGRGGFACPAALVEAIVQKRTATLRRAVVWCRDGGGLSGTLGGLPVVTCELGPGTTAWFVGPAPRDLPAATRLLALGAAQLQDTAHDAEVESLLHPRGLVRPGRAPSARLLVVGSPAVVHELVAACRSALAATEGRPARLH